MFHTDYFASMFADCFAGTESAAEFWREKAADF